MKVVVLMSTYNGEKYLPAQIESILGQKGVDVKLIVRDDGSFDDTISILNNYHQRKLLSWYSGTNMGPARSFLQLLNCDEDASYYAFSDQDDYWKDDKLISAINMLDDFGNVPALYFCQTQLVDKNLNYLPSVSINPLLTFGESLVYEFIGGCTMVFNRALRDIVIKYHPNYLPMHDVWIYSVALMIGAKVVFDKVPHILYRQHGDNTIGQGYSCFHEFKRRLKRIKNKEHSRYRRACELKKGFYGLATEENISILDTFINGKKNIENRTKLITDLRYSCASNRTKFLFKIAVILNTY